MQVDQIRNPTGILTSPLFLTIFWVTLLMRCFVVFSDAEVLDQVVTKVAHDHVVMFDVVDVRVEVEDALVLIGLGGFLMGLVDVATGVFFELLVVGLVEEDFVDV